MKVVFPYSPTGVVLVEPSRKLNFHPHLKVVVRMSLGYPFSSLLLKMIQGVRASLIQEKGIKSIHIGQEEIKLSLFEGNIIVM